MIGMFYRCSCDLKREFILENKNINIGLLVTFINKIKY